MRCSGMLLCVLSAVNLCLAESLPAALHESFDTLTVPALPSSWISSRHRSGGSNDFVSTASTAHSSPNAIMCTNATIEQWVVSPPCDFSREAPDRISFWSRRSSSFGARLVLEASTDGGTTFTPPLGDTLRASGSTSYILHDVPLPATLAGCSSVRFRWHVLPDAQGSTGTLRIDDVVVSLHPRVDACLAAMTLVPSIVQEGNSSIIRLLIQNKGIDPLTACKARLTFTRNEDSLPRGPVTLMEGNVVVGVQPGDSGWIELPVTLTPPGGPVTATLGVPNDADTSNNTRSMNASVSYRRGSVLLNEVMYAPFTGEPEWIELLVMRTDSLSCTRWQMSDASATSRHALSGALSPVPPGGLFVITRDTAAFAAMYGTVPCPVYALAGFPSLNNSGDAVVLYDMTGAVIDSLVYSDAWGGSAGGVSLERIDPRMPTQDPRNWRSSQASGGTPGRENSVQRLPCDLAMTRATGRYERNAILVTVTVVNEGSEATPGSRVLLSAGTREDSSAPSGNVLAEAWAGPLRPGDSAACTLAWPSPPAGVQLLVAEVMDPSDTRLRNNMVPLSVAVPFPAGVLVINEIMATPAAGKPEYVELFNPGSTPVDVDRWRIHDGTAAASRERRGTLSTGSLAVPPGGFLVLANDTAFFSAYPGVRFLERAAVTVLSSDAFSLNDSGDDIVVHDAAGATIDSVAYRLSWHNPAVIDPAGRSIERIHYALPSCDARSWTSCAAIDGGTPGRPNSVMAARLPDRSTLTVAPNPFSPDGDGHDDVAIVRYELPLPAPTVSITLFNVRGQRIRRLMDHEPGAASGMIGWDGRDDNGIRAPVGIYVVLLDAAGANGEGRFQSRTTVVLALQL